MIRFRKNTLARLEFLHQESAKKKFRELLCRDPRCAQGVLYEDIHYAQGSLIRRSSLDAWLHTVALLSLLALCSHYWIETFAARIAPQHE